MEMLLIFIVIMGFFIALDIIDLDNAMWIGFVLLIFGAFDFGDDEQETETGVTPQVQEQVIETSEVPKINITETKEIEYAEEDNGPRIEQTWGWNGNEKD